MQSGTAKTVFLSMLILIVGKALGLFRDRMQAISFGADTPESVAFLQASVLPRTFLDIMFAAAFSASFIPIFNAYIETKNKKAAFDLASLFISIVFVLTAFVAVVGIVFAGPVFNLSLGQVNLAPETEALGAELLRIMFPLITLSGLALAIAGVLQSLGEFRIPAAMSIVSNGIILIYYFFFLDRFGVHGLAAAFLIGWGAQGLIQIPFLVKHRFRFRFRINLRDPGIRQIGALALPVLASSWVLPINLLVNIRAAAPLYGGEFGVPAIGFASSLYTIISGVFVLSVANVIFPKMSRQSAANDDEALRGTINETLRVLFFFLLPLTIGMMVLSEPLVLLILGGGLFGEQAITITATALFYYSPGILGYGLFIILARACYAKQDGRTPLIAALVAIIVNLVLSFALAPIMEIGGPALAGAVGQTLGAAVLVFSLTKKGLLVRKAGTLSDLAKMAGLAAVMLMVVYAATRLSSDMNIILQVLIPTAVGGVFYLGGAVAVRIKEATDFARGCWDRVVGFRG